MKKIDELIHFISLNLFTYASKMIFFYAWDLFYPIKLKIKIKKFILLIIECKIVDNSDINKLLQNQVTNTSNTQINLLNLKFCFLNLIFIPFKISEKDTVHEFRS